MDRVPKTSDAFFFVAVALAGFFFQRTFWQTVERGPRAGTSRRMSAARRCSKSTSPPAGHGPLRHAAGERRDFRRVRQQVAHERQVLINIAGAGRREAEQAGSKGMGGCDGQHGRPAKCEGGGAGCTRRAWHSASAAARELAHEGGCFGAPPATDFDAKDFEMATPGGSELRVRSLLGTTGNVDLEGCSSSAALDAARSTSRRERCDWIKWRKSLASCPIKLPSSATKAAYERMPRNSKRGVALDLQRKVHVAHGRKARSGPRQPTSTVVVWGILGACFRKTTTWLNEIIANKMGQDRGQEIRCHHGNYSNGVSS